MRHPIRFFVLLAIVLSSTTSHAQSSIFNNPDNTLSFSVRSSYEYSDPVSQNFHDSGISLSGLPGVSGTVALDIPLWHNLYLETGLTIFENRYSVEGGVKDTHHATVSHMWIFGGRINCLVGYHFDFSDKFSLAVTTGPQLSIGFSAGAHHDGKKNYDNSPYTLDGEYLKRADVFWNVGLTATIASHYLIGVGFSQGLLNMSQYNLPVRGIAQAGERCHFKEQIIAATLGYKF
jgi:hypothetical protein